MKAILKLLSAAGLILTVIPAFFVLYGAMAWDSHAQLMLIGLVLWFSTAPFWMKES